MSLDEKQEKIYAAKGRPSDNPLPTLHVSRVVEVANRW